MREQNASLFAYTAYASSALSFANSSPLISSNFKSRSSTVSFFFSSPEISKMIFPSFIMIKRLPWMIASFILCVTIMAVRWFSAMILSDNARTFAAVFGSSAAVCSSKSRSFGFFNVAIKSVRAWRCPPESRPTLEVMRSSRPRSSSFKIS